MRRYAFTFLLVGTLLVGMATFGGCDEYAQTQAGLHNSYATPIPDYVPPPETLIYPPATTSTVPATTVVTHVIPATTVPWPEGPCAEWYVTANVVGWPLDLLSVIGEIMWRESRCLPDVTGTGAYGLTQLQWSAHSHWINDLGFSRDDLFNPAINLAVAWELFQRADNDPTFRCGLSPWYMSTPPDIGHWCQRIGQ